MFLFARKQGKREKALLESVELGRTVIPVPATIKPVSVSFFPFSLAGQDTVDATCLECYTLPQSTNWIMSNGSAVHALCRALHQLS